MKTRLLTALIALALAAFVAGASSAQPELVAGWDFSQYAGDGFMSIDGGSTFTNTLSANYSDLDPTNGAGFESAAFGTLYADGQFGSTAVAAGSGSEEFLPSSFLGGSLVSNADAPAVGFDAFTLLQDEGQVSAESLAMVAPSAAVVVFEADLTGAARTGSNWALTFAGRTSSGNLAVGIEFSSDGQSFGSVGTANLSGADSKFSIALGSASTDLAQVRMTFTPAGANQPFIDNVAISAELSAPPTTTTTTTTTSTTSTTTTTTSTSSTTVPTTTSSTTTTSTTTSTSSTTVPTTTSTSSTSTTVPTTTTTTTTTTVPTTTTSTTSSTTVPTTTSTSSTTVPTTTSTTSSTTVPTTTTSTSSTTVPTTTSTSSTTVPTTTTSTTSSTTVPTTTSTSSTTVPTTTTSTTSSTTVPTTTTTTTTTLPGKITLCHKGKNTISTGLSAAIAHLAHGDSFGACMPPRAPRAESRSKHTR